MSSINVSGKRVPVEELLPEIRANVVGIDPNLALQMLMNSAVKMARETKAMEQIVCIPLEACIGSYIVDAGEDIIYDLKRVQLSADDDNRVCGHIGQEDIAKRVYLDVGTKTVYLDPEPTEAEDGMVLELTLAMIPDRRGDTIPEYIFTAWSDALVALTLSNIFHMVDAAWGNINAAKLHYGIYKEAMYEIRRNIAMRNRSMNMRLKPAKGLRGRR